METYEEAQLNEVLSDGAAFGLKLKITSDNKETKWLNIDKQFIDLLKFGWIRGLRDKHFILNSDPEEVISVINSFMERWFNDLASKKGNVEVREAYKFLPTDKQKLKIARELKKDFKRYYE